VDQNFLRDSHPIIEEVQVPPPPFPHHQTKSLVSLFLLSLALPISVFAVLTSQRFSASALKPPVILNAVAIDPGIIQAAPNSSTIQMSALAYDQNGNPVHGKKVVYEWGISSDSSVALLDTKDNTALFSPLDSGTGILWVIARNTSSQIKSSITIEISPSFITPTPTPKNQKPR